MFKIYGDKEKVGKLLDTFIEESKVEYERQRKQVERVGIKLPEFIQIWTDQGAYIKLTDTMPEPPLPEFLKKRARAKACRNLEGYFKTKGMEIRAEAF